MPPSHHRASERKAARTARSVGLALFASLSACADAVVPTAPVPDWSELDALGIDNVVVFHVDTLRADHLPWYGYERNTMPALSAQPGWLALDQHIAASSWTFPSTSSFLSSQRVAEHGIIQIPEVGERSIPGTLWQEAFAEAGFRTAFINGNEGLATATDVDRSWDSYRLDVRGRGNALGMVDPALAWIDTSDAPFFLMLQPTDPHRPWQVLEEDAGTWVDPASLPFDDELPQADVDRIIRDVAESGDASALDALRAGIVGLYDEELLGLDRGLDAILIGLEARGKLDRTLVVLTADHGETLLDDGRTVGHNGSLRRELVHIPLVFLHPDLPGALVAGCPTENIDVMPTLAGLVGVPPLAGVAGGAFSTFGCRGYGASVLFQEMTDPTLRFFALDRPKVRILHNCISGFLEIYDLERDPSAVQTFSLKDVPEARAWLSAAELEKNEVEALWPEQGCEVALETAGR